MPPRPSTTTSYTPAQVEALREYARSTGRFTEEQIDSVLYRAGISAPGGSVAAPGGGGFGQTVGSFGRGVMQGLGAAADINPFRFGAGAANMAAGGPTMRGAAGVAANRVGLPQPASGADSVAMRAGEGLGASIGMPPVTGGLAALGTASGAAGGLAEQAGAPVLGQMAASAAVGMGLPVFGTLFAGAVRSAIRGAGARAAAAREANALIEAGLDNPNAARTLGQVTEGGMARPVEGWLRNNPGSTQAMHRTLDKQADEIGERVEQIAAKQGPAASKQVVGAEVQRSIKEGYIPISRVKQDELYNRVHALVPPTTPTRPLAVYKLFEEKNDLIQRAGVLGDDIANPHTTGLMERLVTEAEKNNGTIPFDVMKAVRSELGDLLDGTTIKPDINLGTVKQLYGALTDDMRSAIEQTGGKAAVAAWDAAAKFTRERHELIGKFLDPLIVKNEPAKAFNALMSGTKDGAVALQNTLDNLEPAAQGLVRSNVLRQLGQMPDESFSPELFFRRYHQLAPEAKAALFHADPDTGANLGALAKMIAERKAAGQVTFNPSGTARATSAEGIANAVARLGVTGVGAFAGSQVLGGPGAALGAVAAPVMTAAGAKILAEKVFTNPNMIRWLVRQTKVPMGAMTQELAILAKDAERWDPASREIANELTRTLAHMDWRAVILGQAAADATAVKQ